MQESFPILMVEDDPNDVFLLRRSMRQLAVPHPIHIARDGQEAIEYLAGDGNYADRKEHPLPGLILLDIKMPRKNGLEVLEWIRNHPSLKRIPVVMVSSSKLQSDIDRAYEIGANAYLVKPVAIDELAKLFKDTAEYFTSAARPHVQQ